MPADAFGRRFPVTTAMLVLNIGVFLLVVSQTNSVMDIGGSSLVAAGVNRPVNLYAGQTWRLITAAFLHAGIIHLAVNMYFLYQVGPNLEEMWGWKRYLGLYLLAAVGGNAFSAIWYSVLSAITSMETTLYVSGVGASTALAGLLGAWIAWGKVNYGSLQYFFQQTPMGRSIGMTVILIAVLGFLVPRIDNAGHLGGALTGYGVALIYARDVRRQWSSTTQRWLHIAGLGAIFVVGLAAAHFPVWNPFWRAAWSAGILF